METNDKKQDNRNEVHGEKNLKINEWVKCNDFSYKIHWPYEEPFNPNQENVDVYVKLIEDGKKYVGTFLTLDEIRRLFETYQRTGENMSGTYLTLEKDIILEEISHHSLETTIRDLLSENIFLRFFDEIPLNHLG